jgi:hypothetical protein
MVLLILDLVGRPAATMGASPVSSTDALGGAWSAPGK